MRLIIIFKNEIDDNVNSDKPNNENNDSWSAHAKLWFGFWMDLAMKECAGCQLAPAVTSGSPHCLRIRTYLEVGCYKEVKFRQRPYHTVRAPTSAKTSYFDSSVFFCKRKNLEILLGYDEENRWQLSTIFETMEIIGWEQETFSLKSFPITDQSLCLFKNSPASAAVGSRPSPRYLEECFCLNVWWEAKK